MAYKGMSKEKGSNVTVCGLSTDRAEGGCGPVS